MLLLCCLSAVAPLQGRCFSLCCVLVGNYYCQIPALLFSVFSENFSASSEASLGAHYSRVPAWSGAAQGALCPPGLFLCVVAVLQQLGSPSLPKHQALLPLPWRSDMQ